MANSAEWGTSNAYIVFWVSVTQNSQSIPANTSSVTVNVYCKRTNTGYTTTGTGTTYVTINGTAYTDAITSAETITSTSRLMLTKTVTLTHHTDGTEVVNITNCHVEHSQFSSDSTTNAYNQTLTTIPRASTIVASNFTTGTASSSIPVVITEFSTAFTYNHSVYCNGTLIASATGLDKFTSIALTDAQNNTLLTAMGTSNSSTVTINLATMSGATQAGSTQTDTCTATSVASTISAFGDFVVGADPVITMTRSNDIFKHDLVLKIGSTTIFTRTGCDLDGTMALTTTEDNLLYNAMTTVSSATATIYCTQKIGAVIRGSTITRTATVTVNTAVIKPAVAGLTAGTVNAITGTYIKNITPITLTMGAVTLGGYSPIASYKINFNGVDYASTVASVGVANTSGAAVVATATVKDSRGIDSVADTVSLNILDYSTPIISSLTVARCDSGGNLLETGTYAKITTNGSIKSLKPVATELNILTYTLYSKLRTSGTWTVIKAATDLAVGTILLAVSNTIGTYAITSSYDFKLEVKDKITTTPIVATATMSTAAVSMSIGKTGIGIGKIWEVTDGALGVEGNAKINGSVTATTVIAAVTGHASLDLALTGGTLSGLTYAATAAVNTSTTQLATTDFVTNQAATVVSPNSSTAAVGVSLMYARQDHNHGDDTSKANLASPVFTGSISSPAVDTDRISGKAGEGFLLGSGICRIDTTGGAMRLYTSNVEDTGMMQDASSWSWKKAGVAVMTIQVDGTDFLSIGSAKAQIVMTKHLRILGGQSIIPGTTNTSNCGYASAYGWSTVWAYAHSVCSDRALKENIAKLDNSDAYDKVKSMNTYTYNYKSDINGHTSGKGKRVMIGAIVDELPIEILDQDKFDGVNLYSYTTLAISALKETMAKVEVLEAEIERLGSLI